MKTISFRKDMIDLILAGEKVLYKPKEQAK